MAGGLSKKTNCYFRLSLSFLSSDFKKKKTLPHSHVPPVTPSSPRNSAFFFSISATAAAKTPSALEVW